MVVRPSVGRLVGVSLDLTGIVDEGAELVGSVLGANDGFPEVVVLGIVLGILVGKSEGCKEGPTDGVTDGFTEGAVLGANDA